MASSSDKEDVIRVLHVDDDPGILKISKQILMLEGSFEIDHALSVDEALRKLAARSYDAVVSDYEMCPKNGLDFLRELREKKNAIPFILFTGRGREEVAVQALNLGAAGYYSKLGKPETVYVELAHGIRNAATAYKAKSALEESQKRYRGLIETTNDFIWEIDGQGKYAYCSPQITKLWGFKPAEMVGKSPLDTMPAEERERVSEYFIKSLGSPEPFTRLETASYDSQGNLTFVESSGVPFFNEHGELLGFRGITRNITQRKKAEITLKESLAREHVLAEFVRNASIPMGIGFPDGKIGMVNLAFQKLTGYSEEELKTIDWSLVLTPPECRESESKQIAKAVATRETVRYEKANIRKDGSTVSIEITSHPLSDQNGNLTHFFAFITDITERKMMEEEIRSTAKFPAENPSPVLRIGKDGIIMYSNAACRELLGEAAFAVGQPVSHHWHKLVLEALQLGTTVQAEESHETKLYSYDFTPMVDAGYVNIYGKDITERKKAEEALRLSEQRYRELVDSLPEAVFEAASNGLPTYLNRKALEVLGYSLDEVKQTNIINFVVPEDRWRAAENIRKRIGGEESRGNEYTILRKDGSRLPALVFTEYVHTLTGEPGLRGLIVNMSDIKAAEAKLALTNEKLRVIGSLTRHDVRNKLTVIKTSTYLLRKRMVNQPELVGLVDGIDSALEQSIQIFDFASLYEKIGSEELCKIDVGESFHEATKLLSAQHTVKIVNECQGMNVIADPMLTQLFYALLDNSMRHGKRVTQIKLHGSGDETGIKLVYEDDGVGVLEENRQQIFEGFTTGGSGLGLKLVKRIIETYGWTIQENGAFGEGAKFTITIPAQNSPREN